MRRIEYQNLSSDLKDLVKRMEKDLNNENNQEKSSVSRLQVLTKNSPQDDSLNTDDKKLEYDIAVFQVDKSKGKYIFSHIENKDSGQ